MPIALVMFSDRHIAFIGERHKMNKSKLDFILGKKFGRLTVLEEVQKTKKKRYFLCECECGNTKVIDGYNLLNGNTKSCGCFSKENLFKSKHNLSHTRLNNIWQTMKQRCYYPKSVSYKNYGARGIKICNEWLENPMLFYEWSINNGYSDNLSIDRIDVNGNYTPDNCRWITQKEQCNNKRNCHYVQYKGEYKTIKELSEILNINYATLWSRIKRNNLQIIDEVE